MFMIKNTEMFVEPYNEKFKSNGKLFGTKLLFILKLVFCFYIVYYIIVVIYIRGMPLLAK